MGLDSYYINGSPLLHLDLLGLPPLFGILSKILFALPFLLCLCINKRKIDVENFLREYSFLLASHKNKNLEFLKESMSLQGKKEVMTSKKTRRNFKRSWRASAEETPRLQPRGWSKTTNLCWLLMMWGIWGRLWRRSWRRKSWFQLKRQKEGDKTHQGDYEEAIA